MKKILVVLLVIFTLASVSLAASGITGKGVKLGINFSGIAGSDISDWKRKGGIEAGGFLVFGISESFAIQPEILISQKGAKYENIDNGEVLKAWSNLTFIEIPVLANFYIPMNSRTKFHPCLFTGPFLGLKIRGKSKIEWRGETTESEIEDSKAMEFGLIFGAGTSFTLGLGKIAVDIRYSWSLTSILKNQEVKNNVLSILFGYSFN
jgi:opacity protein-like surface antigen